ncbi:hypothetical protein M5689_019563 [Euphorbia peplus]|nr:hypothetical protein M5689_019563 [Euphorbia peplus]
MWNGNDLGGVNRVKKSNLFGLQTSVDMVQQSAAAREKFLASKRVIRSHSCKNMWIFIKRSRKRTELLKETMLTIH